MIREILKMGDERLLRIAQPVPAELFDSPELWQLIDDMFQTMESVGGVGLAAPQIGVDLQLVIFGFEHSERYPDAEAVPQTILINPLITPLSPLTEEGFEGCLSVPDQFAEVERPAVIRASWMDRDGRIHEEQLEGLLATCLQHEMDHLEGILFIDHLSRLKRQMVLKKIEKARKMGGGHVHNEHCRH